ncbi:MAG: hypothetical protein K9K66_06875 [Desulfarculaceae bacterium]|nr:hypothetical protein [Desulfarculaceae bacterium]MCF8071813.1 hypothetical protein [Desulfarculaceae bacterium]MCF8101363.1 hypothetical protein [Desulfarculaceae bacterium]MCF8117176.1 hypothetical protein [Desulfarculaceae bacterium]
MELSALILPSTALRRSVLAALCPLFKPMCVLQPPSLEPTAEAAPPGLEGLVAKLRPGGGVEGSDNPQARQAAEQLRQWDKWLQEHQGSSAVDAIKAGVQPAPPPETFRSLMRDIKKYQGSDGAQGPGLPGVEADLLLNLAHIQDQQAAELEQALSQARQGESRLRSSMGQDQQDHQPVDYDAPLLDRLAPVDYTLPQEHLLEQRLSAWATLAAGLDATDDWLATSSGAAARLLLERAHDLVQPPAKEYRTPAGAVSPLGLAPLSARPDNPLAQEAARLVLPDLSELDDQAFLQLCAKLDQDPDMDLLRGRVNHLAQRVAGEKWWPGLAPELGQEAQELAQNYGDLIEKAGVQAGGRPRGLSLLAFPGLSRGDLLALMKDEKPSEVPSIENWPESWPQGATPMWALW